jgi:hypothetical protein
MSNSAAEWRELGIPVRVPDERRPGVSVWRDSGSGDLPERLPSAPDGLTPVSTVTGLGAGAVPAGLLYRRPDGTHLLAVRDMPEEAVHLTIVTGLSHPAGNRLLLERSNRWAADGWTVLMSLARSREHGGLDGSPSSNVIDLAEWRGRVSPVAAA